MQLKDKNISILIHLHPDLRSHQVLRHQSQLPKKSLKSSVKTINTRSNTKQNYNCTSSKKVIITQTNRKAYTFLFGQCTTGLQHRIEAKTKYESKIKGILHNCWKQSRKIPYHLMIRRRPIYLLLMP